MTIHTTFEALRSAYPSLPIEVLQRFGHEQGLIKPLVADGIIGPKTKSGIYLDPQAVLSAGCTPAKVALDELLAGAREIGGPNAGPWVHKYARLSPGATLGTDRGAWCAFFASWVLDAWAKLHGKSHPKEGGARAVVRDLAHQLDVRRGLFALLRVGDLIAWPSMTRASWAGHVGFVAALDASGVYTIEGNVDLRPGVDGVSVRYFTTDLVRADGATPVHAGRLLL